MEASVAASPARQASTCRDVRWPLWLWCNLISLDAPLVAVLWYLLFARCFSVHSGSSVPAALALTVWFIYMADRMLDAIRLTPLTTAPARHVFCKQNWALMASAATVGLFLLAGLCFALPLPVFRSGIIVLAAVSAYFAVVHWGSLKVRRYWPKEIVVGCLFSVGTCLAVWTESAPGSQIQIALPALLFAALCSLNCVAIEYWEWDSSSASWPSQPSPLSLWMGRRVGPLSLITTGASIILLFTSNIDTRPLFIAIAFSSLALFQLSRPFRRLTASSRRVLADAALLTPLLLLAVP